MRISQGSATWQTYAGLPVTPEELRPRVIPVVMSNATMAVGFTAIVR
jgi:hypothetical protein